MQPPKPMCATFGLQIYSFFILEEELHECFCTLCGVVIVLAAKCGFTFDRRHRQLHVYGRLLVRATKLPTKSP